MKRWKIQDIMNLQNKGLIKNINVPAKGSKAIVIPKPDCQQVVWMHWNLQYWCNENSLTLEKEFRFHETRFWRFDFAVMSESLKIAIEYEGIFADKSGHTTVDGFLKDVEKYNAAASLGWTILRYTTKNYKNVLQDLKQIITK